MHAMQLNQCVQYTRVASAVYLIPDYSPGLISIHFRSHTSGGSDGSDPPRLCDSDHALTFREVLAAIASLVQKLRDLRTRWQKPVINFGTLVRHSRDAD